MFYFAALNQNTSTESSKSSKPPSMTEFIVNQTNYTFSWLEGNLGKPLKEVALPEVIALIRDLKAPHASLVAEGRVALQRGDKLTYDKIKKQLPAVTFSATFGDKRNGDGLLRYNNLAILDIDHVSDSDITLTDLKQRAVALPYTMVCFISPSRDGLKLVVKIDSDPERHRTVVQSLMHPYENHLGIELDAKCLDLPRLCFLSTDLDCFHNPESTIFTPEYRMKNKIDSALKYVQKYSIFEPGNRNDHLFSVAYAMNKFGVLIDEAEKYCCQKYVQEDFSVAEICTTIMSAYRNVSVHGSLQSTTISSSSEDEDSEALTRKAKEQLGIEKFKPSLKVALQIILAEMEEPDGAFQLQSMASFLSPYVECIPKGKMDGKLMRRFLRLSPKSLDDFIDELQPASPLFLRAIRLHDEHRVAQVDAVGRKLLFIDYILQLSSQAFEDLLRDTVNIGRHEIQRQLDAMKQVEADNNFLGTQYQALCELALLEA
jgi:hypothetical protein